MRIKNKSKILDKAEYFLKKGSFQDGLFQLKNSKFYFFFQSNSSVEKIKYFFLYGAFLAHNGYYKKALAYLKKTLSSIHIFDKSETYFLLIYSYLNLENSESAEYYFYKLAERSYASPFFTILSYYYCLRNNINLSISVTSLEDLLPDEKIDIIDKLTISLYYLLTGRVNSAFELLEKEKDNYNNNFYFNLIFLKVLYRSDKYEEVVEYFNKNSRCLSSIETLFLYAAVLYKIALLDQCTKVLNEILFIQNNYTKALINLGKIQNIKKNYIQAINIFKNALRKTRLYDGDIYFNLSISYQHLGLLNNVIASIKNISKALVCYHKAIFNLSLLYYDLGKYNEAKEAFLEIDKNKIESGKYDKWKDIIDDIDNNSKRFDLLKLSITLIPFILIAVSIVFFILFYYYSKK